MTTRFRFLISLWMRARLLPFLVRGRPLNSVLSLAIYDGPPVFEALDAAYICQQVQRMTRRPLLMRKRRCLRDGLLGYYFLQAAGHAPELRFAVERKSLNKKKVQAHCWLCLNSRPVLSDKTDDMVEIFVFSGSSAEGGMVPA